ncbi:MULTISPECIES: MarR family winged helix-turn-helix transcriptional regulator [Lelliottia]|jgi:DNA-binding MarR family transcriptional regulator|uniref:MarR family transcriptional regulator n=1 Tax=Lelliottia aquatilis TaxID=2080838 RepID=A0ABX5A940_9ENTR|nr:MULTISPECIES: MarR family transcriptional regulator [Lelliottia]ASV55685.1 Transcriptional regulator, MarR family [Lelliottia jeotgali]NTZ44231.1 MarR family transcriptional regulator [Lelliottia aquatilis]POZ19283.1 MarR family transcriptional regulator [Lelliottia aquatilis]POZ27203.1 MarR family transcriptional regulator [Lelliottia aquatilis]POZ33957.1 MarR family transcriptional regulator [Lelliottia aquatilis]
MQYAHKYDVTDFHGALLDIMGVMNQPQRDDILLSEAGVSLDQILFPLLVAIDRYGPVGVVELADGLGRDYTTVSRQVKRLEAQGLAQKKPGTKDRRVSEVTISTQGKALTMKIAEARMTLMNQIFKDWQEDDVGNLFRLVRKYADSIKGE